MKCLQLVNNFITTSTKFKPTCGSLRWLSSSRTRRTTDDTFKTPKLTVYELRTYDCHPHRFAEFLSTTEEQISARLAYSKLVGYWRTDVGGLNEVVHLWEYDSYSQRAAVRASLNSDKPFGAYLRTVQPMWSRQTNSALRLFPWAPVTAPVSPGGVYELRALSMVSGGLAVWEDPLQSNVLDVSRGGFAHLVGAWHTEVGFTNTVYVMWHYQSMDHRYAQRKRLQLDNINVGEAAMLRSLVNETQSKVLVPLSFSPLH